jgi:2-amino-4-hydroxy-6-hydroxymethyldihydropteridine diphosphokinase
MERSERKVAYLGLGSNLGDSFMMIKRAFLAISNIRGVQQVRTSGLYQTTPVSPIPQNDYINAVCQLMTTLSLDQLFEALQQVERSLGKEKKAKTAPRNIDIDILLFGMEYRNANGLQVPHSEWKKRLFVLIPLWDLVDEIAYPINKEGKWETLVLEEFIHSFPNLHDERVFPLNKTALSAHDIAL